MKKERIQLLNGCSCSPIKVFPKNWESPKASVKKEWYIYYRFYDPLFPKPKLVKIRGMNGFKTLETRQRATKELLKLEEKAIYEKGYNPLTASYMRQEDVAQWLHVSPNTPLIEALETSLKKSSHSKETKISLKSVLKYFKIASDRLRLSNLEVSKIKRFHVIAILEQISKDKKCSANAYNYYRSHIGMLFKPLVTWCAIDTNPVIGIPKEFHLPNKQEVLDEKEREMVYTYLRENHFRHWIYMNIFHLSGGRNTELLSVKGGDVDLEKQTVRVVRKKGRMPKLIEYTITDQALYFWKIAMQGCDHGDYVFSTGLKPGKEKLYHKYFSKWWYKNIKTKLGITKSWYSIKHLSTTEVSNNYGLEIAASLNNESKRMIIERYDVDYEKRIHEIKKKVVRNFVAKPQLHQKKME